MLRFAVLSILSLVFPYIARSFHGFTPVSNQHPFIRSSILLSRRQNTAEKPDTQHSAANLATLQQLAAELTRNDIDNLHKILETLSISMDNDYANEEGENTSDEGEEEVLNGVVRIYCTHSQPNYNMPWQRKKQDFSTSSGFVISKRRIITNAHAVEYGSLIQVKKRQSETKYVATAVAVGHECDLAVLEVNDDSFWENLPVLEFGEMPDLFEDVSVIGYPVGGDSVSITSGVVSRIEVGLTI